MTLIRSISGLRGVINDGLSEQIVRDYATAFAIYCKEGKIVIGRDGRPSGKWIEDVIVRVFVSLGFDVDLIGVAPTPTIQLCVEKSDATGGIAITASHNPSEWNGLKFINESGIFLNKLENNVLWNILDNIRASQFNRLKKDTNINVDENAKQNHILSILRLPIFTDTDNFERIRQRKFNVVVDAVNASGSEIICDLLVNFGCKVIKLFCDGSGVFPHPPEPLPQNLTQLSKVVRDNSFDIGIAVDPDADRLVLVDEKGNCIGEEKTICLAIDSVLSSYKYFVNHYSKTVVINHSTTALIEDIAEKYGAKVVRSAVGEVNVVEKMKEEKSVIGGEGSGGVILPTCHYGRDSLVGIALVLHLLSQRDSSLSELIESYPVYYMLKEKVQTNINIMEVRSRLQELLPNSEIIVEDGLKAIEEDLWVHIRVSNTEPIVRIIVEGKREERAIKIMDKLYSIII